MTPGLRRQRSRAGADVVVFDLGTNDDPSQPGVLRSQFEQVRRTIGNRCLVVATINRPPYRGTSYAAMNRTIEDFAARDGNTQIVPWLLATRLPSRGRLSRGRARHAVRLRVPRPPHRHGAAVTRDAGGAIAGLVIGTIRSLLAAAERIP